MKYILILTTLLTFVFLTGCVHKGGTGNPQDNTDNEPVDENKNSNTEVNDKETNKSENNENENNKGESNESSNSTTKNNDVDTQQRVEKGFSNFGLETNTAKSSIDLDKVLNGGPGKDGIPSIDNPKFMSIEKAQENMSYLTDDERGIMLEYNGEARFYPHGIMVHHEIVNDSIGNKYFVVTFCPLCGSSIIFDRKVDGEILEFGVSGMLYQSNLLMYDRKTESLWSQTLGEAVVGDMLGKQLSYMDANLINFGNFKEQFPNGKVLSDDTGYNRSYGSIPYGNYDENEQLMFPVDNEDERFNKKELFYIVNDKGQSMAFKLDDLKEEGEATIEVNGKKYKANHDNGIIKVRKNGEVVPGYYEMWFSWVNHNPNNKNVWSKE